MKNPAYPARASCKKHPPGKKSMARKASNNAICHGSVRARSVANFLKNFGWKPGISKRKAKKVIYYYNHSDYYVDAVYKVFTILKGYA